METQSISIADYIAGLRFDRIETYSFQRGAEYEETLAMQQQERDALKRRQAAKNDLSLGDERRLEWLDEQPNHWQSLIGRDGRFHWSARRIGDFRATDAVVSRMREMISNDASEVVHWLCGPVYRDAIVFYNEENGIVSVLNICFSCDSMESEPFRGVSAGYEVYAFLKRLLMEIGHPIENPEVFRADELNRLKEKWRN